MADSTPLSHSQVTASAIQWARGALASNPYIAEERGVGYDEAVSLLAAECARIGEWRFSLVYNMREPVYRRDWIDLKAVQDHWSEDRYEAEIRKMEARAVDRDMISDVYRALLTRMLLFREWYRLTAIYLKLAPQSLERQLGQPAVAAKYEHIHEAMRVSATEVRAVSSFVFNLDERQRRAILVSDGNFGTAIGASESFLREHDEDWLDCALEVARSPGVRRTTVIRPEHMLEAGERFMGLAPPDGSLHAIRDVIEALQREFEMGDRAFQARATAARPESRADTLVKPANSLYQDGDLWQIRFNGRTKALSRSVGFALLRALLLHPDRDFLPHELESMVLGKARLPSNARAEPLNDSVARQNLAAAIEEQTHIRDDESASPELRMAAAKVVSQLKAAAQSTCFAGRLKAPDVFAARARDRVYRNVGTALGTLRKSHKEAHAFFVSQIDRRGVYRYRSVPEVEWEI